MKKKKTFNIQKFKEFVNEQLKRTDEFATDEFRGAMCVAIERVLMDANCYEGHNSLFWLDGGCSQWEQNGKTENYKEKEKYIHGEQGSKYKGSRFARRYF